MEVWVDLVQSLGFPIVITIFLLVRFEKTLKNIEINLTKLCERIEKK